MKKYNVDIHISDGIWDCNYQKMVKQEIPEAGCSITKGDLALLYNGKLMLCRRLNIFIGNIYEEDNKFASYWESDEFRYLEKRNFKGICGNCKNKMSCGGCRAYVYNKTGDILQSDDSCFIIG